MPAFSPLPDSFSFPAMEREIITLWEKRDAFRRSVLERYGSKEAYVAAIKAAAETLAAEGFMLEEDVERAIALAADWGKTRHDVKL